MLNDYFYQMLEQERLDRLKKLNKKNIDYDQLLKTVPIDEIERYLRKKKLENINNGSIQ